MAREPENRYKTARALSEDIERWLADAPVSVYREPLPARFGRWIRRHKPLVASAAILFLCAVVGLCVDIVRVGRERAVAEDNFATARQTVNFVLKEIVEGPLAGVPQAEPLRLQVATAAADFSDRFIRQRPHDLAVLREVALTRRTVANIQRMLNMSEAAAQSYRQSIALSEQVLAESPTDIRDELNLALTVADLGEFECTEGHLQAAEQTCLRAVAIADRLGKKLPNNPDCQLVRGLGLLYLSHVQNDLGQYEAASGSADGATTIFRALARHPRDGARNATLFLQALNNWGRALRLSGRAKEAEERLRESITQAKSLLHYLSTHPMRDQFGAPALLPNIRNARSQAELELGWLLADDSQKRSAARDHFELAITELSKLVNDFPKIASYQKSLDAAIRGRDETTSPDARKP
jgi:tetratricopeptide (TPR) repeat protein